MVSREENETLTRVGPGTPAGNMLRRYWWPVGIDADLKDKPTFVRLLGEDLVLFRDASRVGLLAARCSHRRANLCLGNVERDGLRCRYHGWKYAADGQLIDVPGEANADRIMKRVRQPAYPVVQQAGLLLAYLGPQPVPLLPQYDFLAADGERIVEINGFSRSNWLQCVENGIDPTHVSFAHRDFLPEFEQIPDEIRFEHTPRGMVHKTYRPGPRPETVFYREHHLVLPTISVTGAAQRLVEGGTGTPAVSARWTVPIDDHESMMVMIVYKPADNTGRFKPKQGQAHFTRWQAMEVAPYSEYRDGQPRPLGYEMPKGIPPQDASILDSMGPITDRENENLVAGDEAIVMLRRLYLKAVKQAQANEDPVGVFREPAVVRVPAHEAILPSAAIT
jgi:5,5'-dehydrodivanillate O-demethylase oxygenase subunit